MTEIDKYFSANTPLHAAKLFIDLEALAQNYCKLRDLAPSAVCAAVVKANAYGLGLEEIAKKLFQTGCTDFFVAHPIEGEKLRELLPNANIMILNGLYQGAEGFYTEKNLIPVLNTVYEAKSWAGHAQKLDRKLPALLHIDTGMNRLGLSLGDEDAVLGDESITDKLDILCVMSHLACADMPDDEYNNHQLEKFRKVMAKYNDFKASLANSGGILNGADYHFDMTRPGYALYGGKASTLQFAHMKTVVHLHSQFLQIREVSEGEKVGYGATWEAKKECLIGILPIGYADGFARLHGAPSGEVRGHVSIDGHRAPIIGRVSMDLMTVDITELASLPGLRNMSVEILGENITIDDLAESAQTIGYEVLTNLGGRYARHYGDKI